MAEIPVVSRSGTSWVWIILALIVAALLLWWILDDDDDVAPVAAPVAAVAPITAPVSTTTPPAGDTMEAGADVDAASAGPITELSMIAGPGTALVGRTVELENVPVTAVPGDRTFVLGAAPNQLFAVLPEPRGDIPTEDSVNVNPGQRVSLRGTIRNASEAVAGTPLTGLPAGTQVMLMVDRINVVSR